MFDVAISYILLAILLIALIFGAILGFASIKLKVKSDPIVDKIDALLPQTQCAQCGYPGCKPYAQAIAKGDSITKCVPGGRPLVIKLADLMGVEPPASDLENEPEAKVAFIHEDLCIGCTKCVQFCPVDAIIGSNKTMHTVISDLCTGCELCVAPCPTNCIEMQTIPKTVKDWNWQFDNNLIIPVVNKFDYEPKNK